MSIGEKINQALSDFDPYNTEDAKYIVLDDETYFELKIEVLGSVELALITEVEEFNGLRVFHNNIGYSFIDVA